MPKQDKIDTRVHYHQIKRIQDLKDNKGLSFRQIKLRMETEDRRKYDLKSLHHWYHYQLPKGV